MKAVFIRYSLALCLVIAAGMAVAEEEISMLKLYKLEDRGASYWETWDNDDGSYTVHWGPLGDRGETKVVKSSLFKNAAKSVQAEANKHSDAGYVQIDFEDHYTLLIEYAVEGFGNTEDLDKRHRLEDLMNETLGWTGLGACDGGSIGSGTMEVCCYVVDFDLAKSTIEEALEGTEFANYTRIYDEDSDTI